MLVADSASEYEVTKTMRACRKANAYMRSGQHEKAIYWLSQTHALLDGSPARGRRLNGFDTGYMLGAVVILIGLWVASG